MSGFILSLLVFIYLFSVIITLVVCFYCKEEISENKKVKESCIVNYNKVFFIMSLTPILNTYLTILASIMFLHGKNIKDIFRELNEKEKEKANKHEDVNVCFGDGYPSN